MASFLDDVADYLEDQGAGTVATDIFVGKLPDKPDAAIAIFTNQGGKPSVYIPTADPDFQVLVRVPADEHDEGESKCAQIVGILHQLANVTLQAGGKYAYFIALRSEPFYIQTDGQGRHEFSMNFVARIKR